MKLFSYNLKTNHGEAFGTIEAQNAESAKEKIKNLYSGELYEKNNQEDFALDEKNSTPVDTVAKSLSLKEIKI